MKEIKKQSTFSRSLANERKLGAYYTDTKVCEMIGKYLSFPEKHVNVLEPSIGDGSALQAVLTAANAKDTSIYAVEVNEETYMDLKEQNQINYLVNADFLTGMSMTARSFSFCFSNPPYGINLLKDERYEISFLLKIYGTLKVNGVLIYVIPEYVITDETFRKLWVQRFVTAGAYRFPEKVYASFKQCVLFGIRKQTMYTRKAEYEAYDELIQGMEEISPDYTGERIKVQGSMEKEVKYFTTILENPEKNIRCMETSEIFNNIHLEEKRYTATKVGNPIVPLKDDLVYLLSVAGCGQGLAGSKETHDLHLQRGNIKRVQNSHYEAEGEKMKEIVTETSSICMTIIENDGTITRFDN